MAKKSSLLRTLCFGLLFGSFVTIALPELIPGAEAAVSRDKRTIKKLKKKNRGLRKTVSRLRRQLADATRPVPDPVPFIEMVTVDNAGNAPDSTTYGAVSYEFQIGKYEVNLEQYTAFLNAVAATDAYGLYNSSMASNSNIAGIRRNGGSGSYTYEVIGSGKRPVTYVSWFDAARFCNWLHNGRPSGAQDATTTERGAYTLDGAMTGLGFERVWAAKYWIPTEDEWYKAAYHQPSGEDGDSDDYWMYPTMSNSAPGNMTGALSNQANYYTTVYSATQQSGFDINQDYLMDGGSYEGSASFYGTFDQGGSVSEWNDAILFASYRGQRGGSWQNLGVSDLSSSYQGNADQDNGSDVIGFRVASP